MINWHIRNQVLRKLVKLLNSQNVNYQRYINVCGTPYTLCGVFFVLKNRKFLTVFLTTKLVNDGSIGKEFPFSLLIFLGILNQIGLAEAMGQQPMWLVWLARFLIIACGVDFLASVLLSVIRRWVQKKKMRTVG